MQDTYTWRVTYKDGSEVHEPDAETFVHVDQAQVKSLALLAFEVVRHQVDIPDGAHAVFFRRRTLLLNPIDGAQAPGETIHCIGWKREDSAVYLFVFEDSCTLLTNDLQAV